ncbi:portal protein [Paucidesulfovibrio longus]|uniref:portal protein n=1 Tax=Paucidesulfovibrio longus TaxID=889 RepID=UPI0003B692B3|nr:portal protein [Paucidesulfovibrio longus]
MRPRDARIELELAERVRARLEAMRAGRSQWEPVWRDLSDYILPRKNSFGSGAGRGSAGDELIFDSTPTHALEQLASGLGGLLTNPALPWFGIRVRDRRTADRREVREFLQETRERMVRLFNTESTGFQAHVHELYLDIVLLGTAVMYVEADPDTVVRFSTRPLGEVFVAENVRGVVDTVFRQYELTARQAVQEWGEDCSEAVRVLAADRPENKVEILHAVFPRADRDPAGFTCADFPWASVQLETATGRVLEESGYLEMPYMVPRWSKAAGETYGRGPGLTSLSDVRVLSAMSRTALMAAEKMSDPPLMVPDDGFLGPVHTGPGGLSYYRAGSRDRIEALPVAVDLKAAEEMMRTRRESVRRIFLTDQLSPEGPGLTATEAVIRQSEKMRLLGPVLGRMQTEFLSPLIRRVFNILLRAGELPPLPPGLRPRDLDVEYLSPVARAQKQYEAQSLLQVVEYLGPFLREGDPYGVMDNFETDRIARHAAEMFGTPGDYLRPEVEVRARRSAGSGQESDEPREQGARP